MARIRGDSTRVRCEGCDTYIPQDHGTFVPADPWPRFLCAECKKKEAR